MFLAGQVLTADDLNAIIPKLVRQGVAQDVISSTTLVDSSIVVPVNGLTVVKLAARWVSGGGGIKWAWSTTGTVAGSRMWWAPGELSTGSVSTLDHYQHRITTSLTSDSSQIQHVSTASTFGFAEMLELTGDGTLTLQFAQKTSNASATTLGATTWAEYMASEAP